MAQSRKRTLAGQCPRPVQGGPSPPAALGFSAALADSHRVWRGTPVWSGLLGLLCFVLQTLSSRLWSWCAACTHSWSGAPGDVLSLVLLDMLSTSWGLGKAWVSHFFFFSPLWWESGKIQKLWHRNQASEWVTGRYTHHWRKPVQEKGDTAWTPRRMQPVSLKQTKP